MALDKEMAEEMKECAELGDQLLHVSMCLTVFEEFRFDWGIKSVIFDLLTMLLINVIEFVADQLDQIVQ